MAAVRLRIDANNLTGVLNASGGSIHATASTADLDLGDMKISW